MDTATWNVLHDARLVAAAGTVPGDVRLSVEIAHVCRHLPTEAEHRVLTLSGRERFAYQPDEQPPVAGPSAVAALGLGLLSAKSAGRFVTVECADGGYGGQLVLRYASAELRTTESQSLSQSEVESAAERYWSV